MSQVKNASVHGVFNIDQSPFLNVSPPLISAVPIVPIAVASNLPLKDLADTSADVIIELEPINLSFEDFIYLFYYNSGYYFNIYPNNANKFPVTYFNKVYNTTPNEKSIFSLYDQFVKAWTKKYNKGMFNLKGVKLMELQRDVFLTKGIFSLAEYTNGLSLDEVIENLLATGKIKPVKCSEVNEYNHGVPVQFAIETIIYSKALEIAIQVTFNYVVSIPGFTVGDIFTEAMSNPCINDKGIPTTSNDFFDDDDLTLKSGDYESNNSFNPKHNSDNQTVFSEISKFINEDDGNISMSLYEQSSVGNDSEVQSKW
jgi:hypothetical protein